MKIARAAAAVLLSSSPLAASAADVAKPHVRHSARDGRGLRRAGRHDPRRATRPRRSWCARSWPRPTATPRASWRGRGRRSRPTTPPPRAPPSRTSPPPSARSGPKATTRWRACASASSRAGITPTRRARAQGIFDEGYVVVTKAAKQAFLDSSKALAMLAREPKAEALDAEWKKVEAAWAKHIARREVGPRAGAARVLAGLAPAVAPQAPAAGSARFPLRGRRRRASASTRVLEAGRPGKDHLLDSAGAGAAFLDYDKDGRLDVYLVNGWRLDGDRVVERGTQRALPPARGRHLRGRHRPRRRRRRGRVGIGRVRRRLRQRRLAGHPASPTSAATSSIATSATGASRTSPRASGVETPGWNTGAAFFDADGDGWLDLYVAQYIDCTLDDVLKAKRTLWWRGLEQVAFGPFGLKGAPDHFFRNVKGRFVEATEEAGMKDLALGFGFAVRAADFDDDGRPRPLRGQRLRSQLPLSQRRQRPLQGDRRHVLLRLRRQRRRPGQHGRRRSATWTATASRTSSSPTSRRTSRRSTRAWATPSSRT